MAPVKSATLNQRIVNQPQPPQQKKNSPAAEFTWAQVAEHNAAGDCWLIADGLVYNVTEWVDRHPGGRDLVLLAAGRDATQLLDSYHRRTDHVRSILKKYEIGRLIGRPELPTFDPRGRFFSTVKQRIYEYFDATGQDPQFHWTMVLGYVLVLSTVLVSWYAQCFVPIVRDSSVLSACMAVVLGFACAQVGLLPLHDASHCAITRNPWVWRLVGMSHDFVNGCSFLNWCYQHTLGHHPYTNVAGADPDITTSDPKDIRRIKDSQTWWSHYRGQEYFVPVLYGLLGMKVRIQDVNTLFVVRTNDNIRVNPVTGWHLYAFWLGKAFFVFYRLLVPIFIAAMPVGRVLWLFLLSDLVSSYYLAFVFQANHVVEGVEWPQPDDQNHVKMDWGELQVATAQDYAHGSFFWTRFAGALNYQVPHHLFPNISQHYYPQLAPIVAKTCQEFGVRYRVKPTFSQAFAGHFDRLKRLGLNE